VEFSRRIRIDSLSVDLGKISLTQTPINFPPILVQDKPYEDSRFEGQRPVFLGGKTLRENLGRTVAETLDEEPGVAQRTMGPAPARPVLRGLGGNRLLVTENGQSTGDLSSTSTDHAVAIDPINANQIEIIRGPAALIYGPNALGGVVNVNNSIIPDFYPERVYGSLILQGESVNEGVAEAFRISLPYRNLAISAELSNRRAQNIDTPSGSLLNSQIETINGAVGAGYFWKNGFVGAAGGHYDSRYGIPGDSVFGHPNGVDLELEKDHFESQLNYRFGASSLFREIELKSKYNRYYHRELESSGICGVSFGVITYNLTGMVRLKNFAERGRANFGITGEYRDYKQGCLSFLNPTLEKSIAAFYYQEFSIENIKLHGSVRFDHKNLEPQLSGSVSYDSTKAGPIIERSFSGISGGIGLGWQISTSIEITFTVIDAERSLGLDFTVGFHRPGKTLTLSVFRNSFDSYIYPRNTGQIEYGPGEFGSLPLYQYEGQDALMFGFELSTALDLAAGFSFGSNISFVRADLQEDDIPAPFIPPLNGKAWLSYVAFDILTKLTCRAADDQSRLSEFEEPTNGYIVWDLTFQREFISTSPRHSIALSIENITDKEYRKHLSRIKSVMPEPSRNFKLMYKLSF
jgi:iron complex outermembrane receptor protein